MTLRDKSAALRRSHILDAAVRAFAVRGFRRTTIHDVALEAGVADGTIYNAFENKDAILLAILEPLGEVPSVPSTIVVPEDLSAFLHGLIAERWKAFTPDMLERLRIVLAEALVDAKLREHFVARIIAPPIDNLTPLLDALATAGRLRSADLDVTARLISGTFMGLTLLQLMGAAGHNKIETIPSALADFLLRGLQPTAHIASGGNE